MNNDNNNVHWLSLTEVPLEIELRLTQLGCVKVNPTPAEELNSVLAHLDHVLVLYPMPHSFVLELGENESTHNISKIKRLTENYATYKSLDGSGLRFICTDSLDRLSLQSIGELLACYRQGVLDAGAEVWLSGAPNAITAAVTLYIMGRYSDLKKSWETFESKKLLSQTDQASNKLIETYIMTLEKQASIQALGSEFSSTTLKRHLYDESYLTPETAKEQPSVLPTMLKNLSLLQSDLESRLLQGNDELFRQRLVNGKIESRLGHARARARHAQKVINEYRSLTQRLLNMLFLEIQRPV